MAKPKILKGIEDIQSDLDSVKDVTESFQKSMSGKDANGVFTVVEIRRKSNGNLHQKSVLSGGTSPSYTTRTVQTFEADGVTVKRTDVYQLTYDADGDLITQV